MTNETGRSMVEMLGVIAVMGVLSLGGIAGYTLATNRYSANRIIDVAGKLAGMGVGGTTYNSLRAAGLEVPEPNVSMSLNEYGVVCIEMPAGDLRSAVEAQSMQFKCSGDHCGACEGINLDFKKKQHR